jgi:hypothetical protein
MDANLQAVQMLLDAGASTRPKDNVRPLLLCTLFV